MVSTMKLDVRRPRGTFNGKVTGVLIQSEVLRSLKTSPISDKAQLTKFDDTCALYHISDFVLDPCAFKDMTAASYSQNSCLDKNGGLENIPSWENSSILGESSNNSTGSESWSEDSANKIKRRSHRPRGCRGGGSRRARKERRELQFLAQTQQLQQPLPPTAHQCATILPSKQFRSDISSQESELPVLPYLQFSSSFSSSGSDASDNCHGIVNSVASIFDILPSMPMTQPSKSSFDGGGNSSRDMAALPPLPPATNTSSFTSFVKGQNSQISYNANASTQCEPTALNAAPRTRFSNQQTVTSMLSEKDIQIKLDSLPYMHRDVNAEGSVYKQPHHNDSILCNDFHGGYHTTERIKRQQNMLAGGGSLFTTSPKSFLLGKKKGPVYSF